MTDFNKEFELLQQYLDYRIDYTAMKLRLGRSFTIDYNCIPKLSAEGLMKLYQQAGYLIVDNTVHPTVTESRCLTFEEWKLAINQKPMFSTHKVEGYTFNFMRLPEEFYHNPNN